MIPGNNFALELAAGDLRRRARAARAGHPRAGRHHAGERRSVWCRAEQRRTADFAPPEWPPSRGPTPNPKRH